MKNPISKKIIHRNLKLLRFWQMIGFGLITLVVWLSLSPKIPPIGSFISADKLGHLLAYAALMGWFAQLHFPKNYARLALLLIALGISLELMQALSAIRTPDFIDAIANTLGVLIAWKLANTSLGKVLVKIESLIN